MKKRKKENKNLIIGLVIAVIAIVVIFFWLLKSIPNSSNDRNTSSSDVKEVAGLYDIVKIGNLSFELVDVYLQQSYGNPTWDNPIYHTMFWYFVVTNDGENIENVSDCGTLLFEDGSQYNFEVSQGGLDISGQCNYYDIVPGARISTYSTFYFSNSSYIPNYWSGHPKSWEEVSDSKITYFSQQSHGLLKYTIDKKEIVYTNESGSI